MKIFNSFTLRAILLPVFISLCVCQIAMAQTIDEGKTLFTSNCTACHSIRERVVGPALKDVTKRRQEAWLIKWIKNSQALVKTGDATAVQLFKENNESVMLSFETLSEIQIKSIIAYIKAESDAPTPVSASSDASSNALNSGSNELNARINWLLVLISVLLIIIIIQVFNILNIIGTIKGKAILNWNSINSKLSLAFLIIGLSAAGWEFVVHGKLTLFNQISASEHGIEYDKMFMITLALTGVVFVITQILLFWYGFKYKADGKRKALYYPDNHKIEFWWTIVPAVVLTVLVIRGLLTWNQMMNHKDPAARKIEIFAYQFGWSVRYAGADNKLGAHDFRKIGIINALGVDTNDTKAYDDIIVNELHLEVNKPVDLAFRAKDVIHSALLPHFRVQMNVVPGLPTKFSFTPTVTTRQMRTKMGKPEFDYILLCNKICGSAHYRMKMKVLVETKEEFNIWLNSQPPLVAGKLSPVAKAVALK